MCVGSAHPVWGGGKSHPVWGGVGLLWIVDERAPLPDRVTLSLKQGYLLIQTG